MDLHYYNIVWKRYVHMNKYKSQGEYETNEIHDCVISYESIHDIDKWINIFTGGESKRSLYMIHLNMIMIMIVQVIICISIILFLIYLSKKLHKFIIISVWEYTEIYIYFLRMIHQF